MLVLEIRNEHLFWKKNQFKIWKRTFVKNLWIEKNNAINQFPCLLKILFCGGLFSAPRSIKYNESIYLGFTLWAPEPSVRISTSKFEITLPVNSIISDPGQPSPLTYHNVVQVDTTSQLVYFGVKQSCVSIELIYQ